MLIAKAPLQISFAGEGTDLPDYYEHYDGLVISTTINKYVYAIAKVSDAADMQIAGSTIDNLEWVGSCDVVYWGDYLTLPQTVLNYFELQQGLELFLAAEPPIGTGPGYMGAAAVALLKVLGAWSGRDLSPQAIARLAHKIQSEQLDRSAREQDVYAAAFGGFNELAFTASGVTVTPLVVDPLIKSQLAQHLMLFDTGHVVTPQMASSGTDAAIPTRIDWLHTRRTIAAEMRLALSNGDLEYFGSLLDVGWQQTASERDKAEIGRNYRVARKLGALGGRLIAGGRGGFLLLYAERIYQPGITWALQKQGLHPVGFAFEDEGATIVADNRMQPLKAF